MIDQALINLDERLESVNQGMKTVNSVMKPFISSASHNDTPTASTSQLNATPASEEVQALVRKYSELNADWDSVLNESSVLREELKEDKWLTVFRTVNEQADGMMSSLEKAVKRCQVSPCTDLPSLVFRV